MTIELNNPLEFKNRIGKMLGYSNWFTVTQDKIDQFAKATGDYQWIHLDKKKAKEESPFRNTVAHGYYTLSLIPFFLEQIWVCKNTRLIINYGAEKIRFVNPVVCEDEIRASMFIENADDYKNGILIKSLIKIEIKNKEKPALIANTLTLIY